VAATSHDLESETFRRLGASFFVGGREGCKQVVADPLDTSPLAALRRRRSHTTLNER
jgi:hypothetical protein